MPPSSLDASAHPPPNGPLPDPPSSMTPTPSKQQRVIIPKSSTINARTNYVSPYRQNPTRSVSTPLAKSAVSPGNTHSPNFKDIVSRFNDKKDEKIPNPSNRIPAVAAGPAGYRTKKSPAWKPAGGNGQVAPRSNSSGPSGRGRTERSLSAQGTHFGSNGEKVGAGLQQAKTRKASNTSESFGNSRHLPPLDTSVNDRNNRLNGHRRSRSALEIHSPSAASLADTEGESSSSTTLTVKPLRHRRSRSDIEIYNSPDDFEMDPIFARSPNDRTSPRGTQVGRSGIPLPRSRIASPVSPATTKRKANGSKAGNLTPIAVSSHGSRRSPQPISSPRLAAYISAPPPAKSPPLRSSRQRVQQSAGSSAASSRQKFQSNGQPPTPSAYTKDVGIQRGRGVRSSSAGENRGRDIKKKIPELGTIDFAARRARIQSAFNKTLKETNEGQVKVVSRGSSKHSMMGEFEELHTGSPTTLRSAVSQRIDEEDEGEEIEEYQTQPTNDKVEAEVKVETTEEAEGTEPIDTNMVPESLVEFRLNSLDGSIEKEEPVIDETHERPQSRASIISRSSSESSFEDDIPLSTEGMSENQLLENVQTLNRQKKLYHR